MRSTRHRRKTSAASGSSSSGKKYGIIENVSDREYVSNGFHCHVTEDITPIEKQDLEIPFLGTVQRRKDPVREISDQLQ